MRVAIVTETHQPDAEGRSWVLGRLGSGLAGLGAFTVVGSRGEVEMLEKGGYDRVVRVVQMTEEQRLPVCRGARRTALGLTWEVVVGRFEAVLLAVCGRGLAGGSDTADGAFAVGELNFP